LGKSASLELGAGSSSTPTRDGAGGAVSEYIHPSFITLLQPLKTKQHIKSIAVDLQFIL